MIVLPKAPRESSHNVRVTFANSGKWSLGGDASEEFSFLEFILVDEVRYSTK
jgi:hypothetical protein